MLNKYLSITCITDYNPISFNIRARAPLTGKQRSSRTIVWLPPNPKTNPDLDPNPNPNRRAIFFEAQLSGYHLKT